MDTIAAGLRRHYEDKQGDWNVVMGSDADAGIAVSKAAILVKVIFSRFRHTFFLLDY